MNETQSFRKIEQRMIQLINFDDGLWDIMLGLTFMLLAFYPLTRQWLGPELNIVFFLVMLALVVGGISVVRLRLTMPRIGRVRPRVTARVKRMVVVLAVLVLLTLSLVLVTLFQPGAAQDAVPQVQSGGARSYLVEGIVVLVMAGVFSLMAFQFKVARLYLYGWLLGLGNLGSVILEHEAGWTFNLPLAAAAGIIFVVGVVYLLNFMQTYSGQPETD